MLLLLLLLLPVSALSYLVCIDSFFSQLDTGDYYIPLSVYVAENFTNVILVLIKSTLK